MGAGQPQVVATVVHSMREGPRSGCCSTHLVSIFSMAAIRRAKRCTAVAALHGIWWCSKGCPSDFCAPVGMTLSAQMAASADPSDSSSLNGLLAHTLKRQRVHLARLFRPACAYFCVTAAMALRAQMVTSAGRLVVISVLLRQWH